MYLFLSLLTYYITLSWHNSIALYYVLLTAMEWNESPEQRMVPEWFNFSIKLVPKWTHTTAHRQVPVELTFLEDRSESEIVCLLASNWPARRPCLTDRRRSR